MTAKPLVGAPPRGPRRALALRLGLLSGIAAPIIAWGLSVVVIVTWPGYDPIRQSISLLADAPLGWLESLSFALAGLLGLAWALALPGALGASGRDRSIVRAAELVQAAIVLGFAIFPTDPESAPVSTLGAIHLLDFGLYAVSMPVTLLLMGLVMRRDARWRPFVRPTLIAAALAIAGIALVPATLDGPLRPWLGLLERLFVAIPSIWQVATAWLALRARS